MTVAAAAKPTARVGAGPGPGTSNPRTHTVYAVNINDDTVSALHSATDTARTATRFRASAAVTASVRCSSPESFQAS